MRAGLLNAQRSYILVPTLSGTNPGTPLPGGLHLPLNLDFLWMLAHGPAGAPFFQGFAKPVCDLSRGCSVDDITSAAIIMLATA